MAPTRSPPPRPVPAGPRPGGDRPRRLAAGGPGRRRGGHAGRGRGRPPPDVAALTGAQYYWAEHHHPLALVGYIAVLEGHAPAAGLGAALARRTRLPEAAFRTVQAHAQLDAGHVDDVYALLDSLPLTGRDEALLAVSALHTVDALTRIFVRLGRRAPADVPLRETGRPTPTGGPG